MAGEYDASEFVDTDFLAHKAGHVPPSHAPSPAPSSAAAPSRQDVDRKVVEAHQKLAELKRAQEELERERTQLEELRRRQDELQNGRQEVIQQLTRGLALLEEAEFGARRDAEQMAKTAADFRAALTKVQAIRDESWSKENFTVELTRALTAIENARMEWNSARQKLPVLHESKPTAGAPAKPAAEAGTSLADLPFAKLCQIGLAFTWPLLVVATAALVIFLVLLNHR